MKTSNILFVAVVLAASWALTTSAQVSTSAPALQSLNLTAEQKAAIKAIRQNTRKAVQDATSPAEKLSLIQAARDQIKALLTREQQAKLEEIRQQRIQAALDRMDTLLAQLNLTEKQKIEVAVIVARARKAVEDAATLAGKRAAVKSAWDKIKALLTSEQLAQLKQIRQNQGNGGRHAGIAATAEAAAALDLTDTQKAAIKAIRDSTRQQIRSLLTPEQLTVLRQKRANAIARVLVQLNLTVEQKAAIKTIRQNTRKAVEAATTPAEKQALRKAAWEQIKALLTPDQLARLKELLPNR
jgi:Spy/CpxP family protein refolding chaperone